MVLGESRHTYGVKAIFHKMEVACMLRLTYDGLDDADIEAAWGMLVPCTIHEVLQYTLSSVVCLCSAFTLQASQKRIQKT